MLLTSANLYFIFLCLTEEMCKCYMNFMFIKFWALVWETGAPTCLSNNESLREYLVSAVRTERGFSSGGEQRKCKRKKSLWLLSGNKSNLDTEYIWPFPYSWNANYVGSWSSRPSWKKNVSFSLSLILSLYLKPHSAHFISAVLHYFCIRPFSLCLLTCYYITQGHTGCTGIHH